MPSKSPKSTDSPNTAFKRPLRLLFVDDQTVLLNAIERVVRRRTKSWKIELADSAPMALAKLEEQPFDVIVTDMQMPDMDGLELLENVRESHPNMIRFILSGYSKNERTIESIRVAHQFFIKPFSTHQLIDALELTHSLYKRIRNPALQSIIASIDRLPTPRKIYFEIQQAVNDPNTSVEAIASIIIKDTAITGKILQVVNSAFFGQSQHIESIQRAVSVLGVESIRSLVLIAGIASDHKELLNGIISIDLYTDHCLEVAILAKKLGEHLSLPIELQDSLFTLGLLHDVGKLLVLKKYVEVYHHEEWKEDPYTTIVHLNQIEKVKVDHSLIGAALVALWGIPAKLVNAIAFHETPLEATNDEDHFACILHLADAISCHLRACRLENTPKKPFKPSPEVVEQMMTMDTLMDFIETL